MDIKAASTDQRIPLRVVDESGAVASLTHADFTSLYYLRPGGAKVTITPAAGALEDAHSDGKVAEIGNGWYELHAPDAAFAAGVPWVIFGGTSSSGEVFADRVNLIGQATTAKVQDEAQTGDSYAVVTNATYGLDKLVRSSTPANALAVDGDGKVVSSSVTDDVGGKVLGGGSGTITGIGVRAVDGSGNAIAPAETVLTAQQVWEYATRTLSEFTFEVTPTADSIAAIRNGLAITGEAATAADALVVHGDAHWATADLSAVLNAIGVVDGIVDRIAVAAIGDVSGAGSGTEVFVYGGVTLTATVDQDGNRTVVFS